MDMFGSPLQSSINNAQVAANDVTSVIDSATNIQDVTVDVRKTVVDVEKSNSESLVYQPNTTADILNSCAHPAVSNSSHMNMPGEMNASIESVVGMNSSTQELLHSNMQSALYSKSNADVGHSCFPSASRSVANRCGEIDTSSVQATLHSNDYLASASCQPAYCDILNKSDIEDILDINIPEGRFTVEIPRNATFKLNEVEWSELRAQQNKRCFKIGSWQNVFVSGLRKSNPHCCFIFQYHKVSAATSHKSTAAIFSAKARCKFKDCSIVVLLKMCSDLVVNVTYSGVLSHDITEVNCRPIRAAERDALKREFKMGAMPLKKYLDVAQDVDNVMLVTGNCHNLGFDTHVF